MTNPIHFIKNYRHFLVLCTLPLILYACPPEETQPTQDNNVKVKTLAADIHNTKECNDPNKTAFTSIIAYKNLINNGTDRILQLGAETDNKSAEIIVNISSEFGYTKKAYPFEDDGSGSGYAWLVYQPTNSSNNAYTSTGLAGTVEITDIKGEAGKVDQVKLKFTNVQMAKDDDTMCISGNYSYWE